MPLQPQTMNIPLLGLETSVDAKQVAPGKLVTAENCVVHGFENGRVSYKKRFGQAALAASIISGGSISAGKRLGALGDELLLNDGTSLHAYSSTAAKWMTRGTAPRCAVTSQGLAVDSLDQAGGDVAVSGNYAAFTWHGGTVSGTIGGPRYAIKDLTTGAYVVANEQLESVSSAMAPRVCAMGADFFFFYEVTSDIRVRKVAAATPTTLGAAVTLTSDCSGTTKHIDVLPVSSTRCLVAYRYSAPGIKVLVVSNTPALTASSTLAHATAADQSIGWLQQSTFALGSAYLAEGGSVAGVRLHTVAVATGVLSAATVIEAAATDTRSVTGYVISEGTKIVVYDIESATSYNTRIRWCESTSAPIDLVRSAYVGSKAFVVNGRAYVTAAYDSTEQPGFQVIDMTFDGSTATTSRRVVAKFLQGTGGGKPFYTSGITSIVALSATEYVGSFIEQIQADPLGYLYGARLVMMDFDASKLGDWIPVNRGMVLPGGSPRWYDGKQVVELGYTIYPEAVTLTDAAAGLMGAGTYQYAVEATWFDSLGLAHRSATSEPTSITLGASRQVTVTIPTLRITARNNDYGDSPSDADVRFRVFRTLAGGSIFYLVSGEGAVVDPINDTTADTVTFADNFADATISDNEELYTTSGELDAIGPPPCRCGIVYNNHLVLASSERDELWVSKELVPGYAPEFSDDMVVPLPLGQAYAMAVMDGRLVLFHESGISYLAGPGPNNQGVGLFEIPQELTTPFGVNDPRLVIAIPEGILFKAPTHGIHLLSRGMSVEYVGYGIDAYKTLTFTGAMALPAVQQARFTTSDGTTLVYHWQARDDAGRGLWTTFTNQAAVSCVRWMDQFAWVNSGGIVRVESSSLYSDDGAAVTMRLITGWLRLARHQRLWEAHPICQFMASHTFTVILSYDFSLAVAQTETLAVTTAITSPVVIRPTRQEFLALLMYFQETSTTQGFIMSALDLELGIEQGLKPLAVSQRMA